MTASGKIVLQPSESRQLEIMNIIVPNCIELQKSSESILRPKLIIDPAADGDKEKTISTINAKVNPWMQQTLQGYGNGLRRSESERIFAWCNYVTAGVISAGKTEFTVNTITQLAHAHPRNFVAVVLLPNRSGDLRMPATKHLVLYIYLLFSLRFFSGVWFASEHLKEPKMFHRPITNPRQSFPETLLGWRKRKMMMTSKAISVFSCCFRKHGIE